MGSMRTIANAGAARAALSIFLSVALACLSASSPSAGGEATEAETPQTERATEPSGECKLGAEVVLAHRGRGERRLAVMRAAHGARSLPARQSTAVPVRMPIHPHVSETEHDFRNGVGAPLLC